MYPRILLTAPALLMLAACGGGEKAENAPSTDTAATTPAAITPAAAPAATPAATTTTTTAAPAAPAPGDTATVDGTMLANFTGDAAAGEKAFAVCRTCHVVQQGVNRIGPSLHGIVGREAGTIASYNYSAANKNSGITWTPDKMFQYLENVRRVVPGTKMALAGVSDPQKRADIIAYLQTQS